MDYSDLEITTFAISIALWLIYHGWYVLRLRYSPSKTITGWTNRVRKQWVEHTVSRQGGPILAVQTLRNWILAATLLATACVTLSLSVLTFLASASRMPSGSPYLTGVVSSPLVELKTEILLFVYMAGFFCFANSTRYFNHVGMSINVDIPHSEEDGLKCDRLMYLETGQETVDHVAKLLNTGNAFFSWGLRFIYLSFPCLLWFFNPYLMLVSTVLLLVGIHFGDQN